MSTKSTFITAVIAIAISAPAFAADELNLYSSRHYDTDERLYSDFTDATGITINRIEGKPDKLLARIKAEGVNSPADIFLTVDSSRLARAADAGLLQSIDSAILEERIPAYLQNSDNKWFGFSQRARIIFYDKNDVANPPMTYMDLADPKFKGKVCHRSSTNVYSQTLMSAIIENHGSEKAAEWAKGFAANFARSPQGGDTDQLRGIVSGECEIAVANTYYFARALRKDVKGLSEGTDSIGWVFPSQDAEGAHMNISGAGVLVNAPNKDNAVKFLEYLASDAAQKYFSDGNDEYPAVAGIPLAASVAKLGDFKPDTVDLTAISKNLEEAQKIFNKAGWE